MGTFENWETVEVRETGEVRDTGKVGETDQEKTKEIEGESVFEALGGVNVKTGGGFSCMSGQTEGVSERPEWKMSVASQRSSKRKQCQVRWEGKLANWGHKAKNKASSDLTEQEIYRLKKST